MRTETRQVTVEREVYIADDGTEFEDEDSCNTYEMEQVAVSLPMYDDKYKRTDDPDLCTYVELLTYADLRKFRQLCKYCGCYTTGLDDLGLYMAGYDGWLNLTTIIREIEKEKQNEKIH